MRFCNRADETAYDPADRIIVVANNQPKTPSDPYTRGFPYATFISALAKFSASCRLPEPLDWSNQRGLLNSTVSRSVFRHTGTVEGTIAGSPRLPFWAQDNQGKPYT